MSYASLEIKEDDREPSGETWILVGATGTGKSLLVNCLTPEDVTVTVRDDEKPCTEKATMYDSLYGDFKLLDTKGTNNQAYDPYKAIKFAIANMVGFSGYHAVKIIWMVHPNSKQSTQNREAAAFIESLNSNIWPSVIIIGKKGDLDDLNGVVSLNKNEKRWEQSYSLHLLDKIRSKKKYKESMKKDFAERIEDNEPHIYTHEIYKWLNSGVMGNIPSCRIDMKKVYYHSKYVFYHHIHSGYIVLNGKRVAYSALAIALLSGTITLGVGAQLLGAGVGSLLFGTTGYYHIRGRTKGGESRRYLDTFTKWDCCQKIGFTAEPCDKYVECWKCRQNVNTRGCKYIWVPRGYSWQKPYPEFVEEETYKRLADDEDNNKWLE